LNAANERLLLARTGTLTPGRPSPPLCQHGACPGWILRI